MAAESEPAWWLVPFILIAFPLVFGGIWSLVCALLATVSGYRSLVAFRLPKTRAAEGDPLPTPWFTMIGIVSYRGRVLTLRASQAGLILRVLPLFPFHPQLCIPWQRLVEDDGGVFGRWVLGSLLIDGRVRLRVPMSTLDAIREARARYSGEQQA